MADHHVLFIIMDALRADKLSLSPTLESLAADNLSFEMALAPGRWSLPSHASLMTGSYPHEHGLATPGDSLRRAPVLHSLRDAGYATYGVSANSFFSPTFDFDEFFDEFVFTPQSGHPDGLDVATELSRRDGIGKYPKTLLAAARHENPRKSFYNVAIAMRDAIRESEFETGLDVSSVTTHRSGPGKYPAVLRAALTHERPLRSLYNVGMVGSNKLCTQLGSYVRNLRDDESQRSVDWQYDPADVTAGIRYCLDDAAATGGPFFLMANYMTTHHPYLPSASHRRLASDGGISEKRMIELNEDVAYPWRFLETREEVPQADIDDVRALYDGEVRRVDDHVSDLLAMLDERGLREDTIVVVTADHGELLGERDDRGQRLMGHVASVDDRLIRVPLIIAHPQLPAETVSDVVELHRITEWLTDARELDARVIAEWLRPDEGVGVVECPAVADESPFERYSIPERIERWRARTETVVARTNEWKYAANTDGERWAWRAGESTSPDDAPETLRRKAAASLSALQATTAGRETGPRLDADTEKRLQQLGYI